MKASISVIFVLLFTISNNSFAKIKDSVIANVNGKTILKADFDRIYHQNLLFVGKTTVTKKKVLNDLINRQLGIQKAQKAKLFKNPTVKYKMEDVMYHAQVSKDLENVLKKIKVTEKDIKKYYKNHKEYRTAHILFRLKAEPSNEESDAARNQAFKISFALQKNNSKFAEYANKFSQSSTAPNGGDLGFQPSINYAPEYFKAINGKTPGHITPPIRTRFGYHIVKILAIHDFKSINKSFYKKIVYDQKKDKVLSNYFASLRKNARIEINDKLLK